MAKDLAKWEIVLSRRIDSKRRSPLSFLKDYFWPPTWISILIIPIDKKNEEIC